MKSAWWLLLLLPLVIITRISNWAEVHIDGSWYFVDADCYSRMTRVAQVVAHPGLILRHHDFENYPLGLTPHTSAVFDYLVAMLAWMLKPFTAAAVDLAGAIISPLLALATAIFLWSWAGACGLPHRGKMITLFAISPILVHGTALARPDHQSLLIFLIAAALGAEWRLTSSATRRWSLMAGAAWGLALWVSLFEPAILWAIVQILRLSFARLSWRNALPAWLLALGIWLVGALIERRFAPWPGGPDFERWAATIGELRTLRPWNPVLWQWTGLAMLLAPFALGIPPRNRPLLIFLLATFALTLLQARWGYFLALVFVMVSPWIFAWLRRPWLANVVFIVALWPLLGGWDARLFGDEEARAQQRSEAVSLRAIALTLREAREPQPVLAPWWNSPAIAYWSGQACVGGSSHESLPGIVDSARFFTATDPATAEQILRERQARIVIVSNPDNLEANSAAILGIPPNPAALVFTLFNAPHSAPPFLHFVYADAWFKVFAVTHE